MPDICCCFRAEDMDDYLHSNRSAFRNCVCLTWFAQNIVNMCSSLFGRGQMQPIPQSSESAASMPSTTSLDDSLSDMYRSPPTPMPYDADPAYYRMHRGVVVSRREKGTSHSHEEAEPLRSDSDEDSESFATADKWNVCPGEDQSKDQNSKSSFAQTETTLGIGDVYTSSEDEDVCPTCFEDYTEENPRIILQCSHHYHLGCILEWMERSDSCPVCGKVMVFNEAT